MPVSKGYSTAVSDNGNVGTVTQGTRQIIEVKASIAGVDYNPDAEYHLIVNGKIIRRMNSTQAMHLGLTQDRW